MNVVMLAGDSPTSAYLYREIAKHQTSIQLVRHIDVPREPATSRWDKLRKRPIHTLAESLRLRCNIRHARRLEIRTSQELFGCPTWPTPKATREIPALEINSQQSAAYFASSKPDIMLVCGAPILKPEIFSIARLGTINLHFGIAPDYRGEHALWWAMYLGDWDRIGFTLHCVDHGVDTGKVLAHGYPALDRHDMEAKLWAKCTRMAAHVIVELLQSVEKAPLEGMMQRSGGRFYYARERTIRHHLNSWRKRSIGKLRPPVRLERVEAYFGSAANMVQGT